LVVGAGASLAATGEALITLEDINFQIDGALNPGTIGDQAYRLLNTFRFTGNTTTTISGSGSPPVFSRIEIAKTGGLLRSLRIISVYAEVSLISGLFDLDNNWLLLMNDYTTNQVSLIGESETSRIIGGIISAGSWTLPPNTPINIANLGLEITSLSPDCRSVNIYRGHTPQTGIPGVGTSISRYYDIRLAGGECGDINPFNTTVRFNYFDGEVNGLNENNLLLWKGLDRTGIYNGQNFDTGWANLNYSSRNLINNYIDQTAFIESSGSIFTHPWISRFTLSTSNPARPFTSAPQQIKTIAVPGKETITNKWKTWPNPADKILWIDITSASASQATTSIFDSKGSLIRTQTTHLTEGSNRLRMDLKNFAAGIYYITTTWDTGKEKRSTSFLKL
ncbi:MAG TPA: T9SS type A sorting domain-containing protein, partial [Chitinophagaceae bacterium]|nr:T9SS type A sorting domain-containing protein [Chitinophagaceae bacterium]